ASPAALARSSSVGGTNPKEQTHDAYLLMTDSVAFTNNHLSLRFNRQKFTGVNFENGNTSNSVEHTGNSLVKTDTFTFNDSQIISGSFFNDVRGPHAKDRAPGVAHSADPEPRAFEKRARALN